MNPEELLNKLMECVEFGKVNKNAPFPPAMKGQDGADELTRLALDMGIQPTLILNEKDVSEFDFGGRTAEAVKTVLCCGFNNQPSFCSQKLTTEQAASSFSETYNTSSDSSSSGNCD